MLSKMWVILLIAICGLLLSSHGQRTHSRSCDCEYMENGKCVYKLLLPAGGQGAGTCPSDSGSGAMSVELQNSISKLEKNLTDMSLKYSSQTSQINQIYSTLFDKLLTCNAFRSCVEEPSSGEIEDGDSKMGQGNPGSSAGSSSCSSVCPDLIQEIAAIKISVQDLTANTPILPSSRVGGQGQGQAAELEKLSDDLKQVQTAITNLNGEVSKAAEAAALKTRVDTLENNLEYDIEVAVQRALTPINTRVNELSTRLDDMRSDLCIKKGPLVKEIKKALEKEDLPVPDLYTASSQFVNDFGDPINPAGMALINNVDGAWCPGKCHSQHTTIVSSIVPEFLAIMKNTKDMGHL